MAFCSECGYNLGDSSVCPICKTVNDTEFDNNDFCETNERRASARFFIPEPFHHPAC